MELVAVGEPVLKNSTLGAVWNRTDEGCFCRGAA